MPKNHPPSAPDPELFQPLLPGPTLPSLDIQDHVSSQAILSSDELSRLEHWPEKLRALSEKLDYPGGLDRCKDLNYLEASLLVLFRNNCESRLLEVARKFPVDEVARLAKNTKLRRLRYVIENLSRDPKWDLSSFLNNAGSLHASFFSAEPIPVAEFVNLLKRRGTQSKNDRVLRAWVDFSRRALQPSIISKVESIQELHYLLQAVTRKTRAAFLRAALRSSDSLLKKLLNEASVLRVARFVASLAQNSSHQTASQVLGLIRQETWHHWLNPPDETGWKEFLAGASLLVRLCDSCDLESVPQQQISATLLRYSRLDKDKRISILRQLELPRFADLLDLATRQQLARHRATP